MSAVKIEHRVRFSARHFSEPAAPPSHSLESAAHRARPESSAESARQARQNALGCAAAPAEQLGSSARTLRALRSI
jgi:hypothetical protein